jgi:hypothetical protein
MITMKLRTDRFQKDVERFARQKESDFVRIIAAATAKMHKMAKTKVRNYTRRSKVKSNYLINHIIQQITSRGLTGRVISNAGYSEAFEEGTRPHTIRVRTKKVLAGPKRGAPAGWDTGGKSASMGYAVYGRRVQHPGTQPHPFMFPSWRYACNYFEKLLRKAL